MRFHVSTISEYGSGECIEIFDRINFKISGDPAAILASDIDNAESLLDLEAAIDRLSDAAPYQILHFCVCKVDDIIIQDTFYSRPVKDIGVATSDFSDELRVMVINETLSLMTPFDLLHHKFETCETGHFDQLRKMAATLGIDGVIVVPYRFENTISFIVIRCSQETFLANMSNILPLLFLLISKTFSRFPTLAKWPDEYRLTEREAEILQITSQGAIEKEIARKLGIGLSTVRAHIENAKRKLDARSKAHAIMIATHIGEINPMSNEARRK